MSKYGISRVAGAIALVSGLLLSQSGHAATELNILGWCDVDDPRLIQPFEDRHDVRINIKVHEDPGVAHNILMNSEPGEWDVVHTDSSFVATHVEGGVLQPLNMDDYPWDDLYEAIHRHDLHMVDGQLYAVPNKVGVEALAYNADRVDLADLESMAAIWDPKFEGRVGVWDFYIMAIEAVALAKGVKPDDLNESHIPMLREALLSLKPQIAMIGDPSATLTAMASGDIDLMLGGGDWLGNIMVENPSIRWTVPKEGGVYYLTSTGIAAGSRNPELANEFVKYLSSPEGQAIFATSACYWGSPINNKVELSEAEAAALRFDELGELLDRSYLTIYFGEEFDKQLQELWAEFLQN